MEQEEEEGELEEKLVGGEPVDGPNCVLVVG